MNKAKYTQNSKSIAKFQPRTYNSQLLFLPSTLVDLGAHVHDEPKSLSRVVRWERSKHQVPDEYQSPRLEKLTSEQPVESTLLVGFRTC